MGPTLLNFSDLTRTSVTNAARAVVKSKTREVITDPGHQIHIGHRSPDRYNFQMSDQFFRQADTCPTDLQESSHCPITTLWVGTSHKPFYTRVKYSTESHFACCWHGHDQTASGIFFLLRCILTKQNAESLSDPWSSSVLKVMRLSVSLKTSFICLVNQNICNCCLSCFLQQCSFAFSICFYQAIIVFKFCWRLVPAISKLHIQNHFAICLQVKVIGFVTFQKTFQVRSRNF